MTVLLRKTATFTWVFCALLPLILTETSQAAVTLLDTAQWKVLLGGFVEVDTINDSTRSFSEIVGNNPVARPDSVSGETGREQFSIRNTRFSLSVQAPDQGNWKTKGYIEFDLLGYDPSPGSTNTNTEAGLYNNPTLRVRHAFIQADLKRWSFLAGQTWAVFGWQPYYFMPSVQIAPVPSMLYSRTTQFHALYSSDLGSRESHLQAVVGVMRPPQRDSALPGLETGVRFSYDGWSGGYVASSTAPQKVQPLSIGVSGTVRDFTVPTNTANPTGQNTHYMAGAIAVDTLIPVIAADGRDVSNTLSIGGEFTTGNGYGDQFANWTGGMANPLSTAPSAPSKNLTLDPGIGGYDGNGNFQLVDLRTYNLYAQFHFDARTRTWMSVGVSRLYSDNIQSLTNSLSAYTAGYNKEQIAFVNIFRDLTDHVRVGLEYAQIQTTYIDGTLANDNRYQASAWFFF